MKVDKIYLPWPTATGNHYKGVNYRTKRFFVTKKAQAYRMQVKVAVVAYRGLGMTIDYPVDIVVKMYPPDRRARDTDNVEKVLYDALTHAGLWRDDKLVKRKYVEMCEPDEMKKGYITLEVEPYDVVISASSAA